MKTSSTVVTLLAITVLGVQAQLVSAPANVNQSILPKPTEYRVIEQGANRRVWQRETYEPGPNGAVVTRIHKVQELATGLNYLMNGQWVAASDQIDILPDGSAAATHGQHQVYFPADIYQGVIRVVTPDGQELRSQPTALAFDDGTSTMLIAVLTNSVGRLVGTNQVIYKNAFAGVKADLLYTYKHGGFEQDIILRAQIPAPRTLNLNLATTRVQVLTEFFDPPTPVQQQISGPAGTDSDDTTLKFSSVTFGHGKAFLIGNTAQTKPAKPTGQVTVYKSWLNSQGRTFLIESVPYKHVTTQLQTLPLSANGRTLMKSSNYALHEASGHYLLPPMRVAQASTKPIQLAEANTVNATGLVLDYFQINSGETNFTFQGDTTYYVSGEYNLRGTTTIEGGSVIKMNGSGQLDIDINGTVNCATGPYRPAVFTSVNDNAVGESFGSGTPAFGDAYVFLNINATNAFLHDLRFSYCWYGINQNPLPATLEIWNCQFINVDIAMYGGNIGLHNVLISRSVDLGDGAVAFAGTTMVGENVTANGGYAFVEAEYSGRTVSLTNCLVTGQYLISSINPVVLRTNFTVYLPSPSTPVYQTVGVGSFYLTNNSPYRDYGTTNINATLLAALRTKTTYPPMVYSNTSIALATNFSPQATRETNSLMDLGYHYDCLDYVFGGVDVNSNITFSAGTAVGWFELPDSWGNGYGISITNGKVVTFNGTVTSPCYFVRYSIVQEGGNGNWTDRSYPGGIVNQTVYDPDNIPILRATFTRFLNLHFGSSHFRDGSSGQPLAVEATHCEILNSFGGYNLCGAFTNCLLDRVGYWQGTSATYPYAVFRNCTFHGGTFDLVHWEGGAPYWYSSIRNCAFDGTTNNVDDPFGTNAAYADYNFNAFVLGGSHLPSEGTNNVTVTNFNWQSSWLGDYYLPTNSAIINMGTTNANLLGFYHFTTQTNQTKEANSLIDIGYHYVAVDAYGNPIDINDDGVFDYVEDLNGNGMTDLGEESFGITIENPMNGSNFY